MKNEEAEKILDLSRQVIRTFWSGQPELYLNHLHPEVSFIGPADGVNVKGREELKKLALKMSRSMPKIFISNERYEMLHYDRDACIVAAYYTTHTDPKSHQILRENKRCTLVWIREGDAFLLLHVHDSDGHHMLHGDESFPIAAGQETYNYMMELMRQRGDFVKITVRDTEGVTHVISENDILLIQTEGNYTTIRCFDRNVRIKRPLKYVRELLHTEIFVEVSRNTMINGDYVERITGDIISLIDKTEIRISSRKVNSVLKVIRNLTNI